MIEFSASDLSAMIARKEVSPREVAAAFLDRIEAVNPAVNAVVSLRPRDEVLAEADCLGERRGWLHGLPVAVKDLAAVRGVETTWGSPLFKGHLPEADDGIVRRMRDAGAIIIGKTNAPEFGLGSHTFNEVFGPTSNPYDLARSAGGSSGGAAAALAARMVPVADGSDMMGSLRNPAAFCNVYGFRPTWGVVPADPVGDVFLHQLATEGPMGRSVEDIARLLDVLHERDPRLPNGRQAGPFGDNLNRSIDGLRIGWLGDWGGAYPVEQGILAKCEAGLSVLESLGAHVEPVAPPFSAQAIWSSWTTLRSWAVAAGLRQHYLKPEDRAHLKPEAIWEIERGLSLTAMAVHEASEIRSAWYFRLAELFAEYDLLVLPAAQVWPFPVEWRHPTEINGLAMDTYHRWMEVVVPVSLAGLPCLSVPVGFGDADLPMGMQLFGARGSDALILQVGQAYHQATDWPGARPPPI